MAIDPSADLFDALYAIYNADSDKLSGGGFDGGVREFRDDEAEGLTTPVPYILVDIAINETDPIHGGTTGRQEVTADVRFYITTDKERTIDEQDYIKGAIRTKFHGATLTGSNWAWSDGQIVGDRQLDSANGRRKCVVLYTTLGNRTS